MRTLAIVIVLTACGGHGGGNGIETIDGPGSSGGGKKVFVTQADFLGNFSNDLSSDGATLADTQCTSAANGAGLAGTFHAWLSRYGGNGLQARTATAAVTGDGPWLSTGPNHEVLFLNRASLSNTPAEGINYNEHGALVTFGPVWTGTAIGGNLGSMDCNQWRSGNSAQSGTAGEVGSTTSSWTDNGLMPCSERAHLYCFQM